MFCNKCGQELSDDATFCTKCGNPVSSDAVAQSAYQQNPVSYAQQNNSKVTNSVIAMWCGIGAVGLEFLSIPMLSLSAVIEAILCYILSVASAIVGLVYAKKAKYTDGKNAKITAGMACSIIGLSIIGILIVVMFVAMFIALNEY